MSDRFDFPVVITDREVPDSVAGPLNDMAELRAWIVDDLIYTDDDKTEEQERARLEALSFDELYDEWESGDWLVASLMQPTDEWRKQVAGG